MRKIRSEKTDSDYYCSPRRTGMIRTGFKQQPGPQAAPSTPKARQTGIGTFSSFEKFFSFLIRHIPLSRFAARFAPFFEGRAALPAVGLALSRISGRDLYYFRQLIYKAKAVYMPLTRPRFFGICRRAFVKENTHARRRSLSAAGGSY